MSKAAKGFVPSVCSLSVEAETKPPRGRVQRAGSRLVPHALLNLGSVLNAVGKCILGV